MSQEELTGAEDERLPCDECGRIFCFDSLDPEARKAVWVDGDALCPNCRPMKLGPHQRGCHECQSVFVLYDQQILESSVGGNFDTCKDHEELNPGRDLRAEAKAAVLEAVEAAKKAPTPRHGIRVIMDGVHPWTGPMDDLFRKIGLSAPASRPPEVFQGVSDAFLELDPRELTVRHILALLTAAFPNPERFAPGRAQFVEQAIEHLQETRPNEFKRLLSGLT